uniref:Uncharacterized protein n=1 Tax=Meloidogyne enterolobii TaxID=390850 RepID=A0A6V7TNB6_MELEN|nr:unnamed protein product [Meloidogyne enterolobii]CAD2188282.1 unnamed protein product [Meloidogyne enterolobii]
MFSKIFIIPFILLNIINFLIVPVELLMKITKEQILGEHLKPILHSRAKRQWPGGCQGWDCSSSSESYEEYNWNG